MFEINDILPHMCKGGSKFDDEDFHCKIIVATLHEKTRAKFIKRGGQHFRDEDTLNGHTYSFERIWWVKPSRKWRTPTPRKSARKNNIHRRLTQRAMFRHKQLRVFCVWERGTKSKKDKKLTGHTTRITKLTKTYRESSGSHQETRTLVHVWKI